MIKRNAKNEVLYGGEQREQSALQSKKTHVNGQKHRQISNTFPSTRVLQALTAQPTDTHTTSNTEKNKKLSFRMTLKPHRQMESVCFVTIWDSLCDRLLTMSMVLEKMFLIGERWLMRHII